MSTSLLNDADGEFASKLSQPNALNMEMRENHGVLPHLLSLTNVPIDANRWRRVRKSRLRSEEPVAVIAQDFISHRGTAPATLEAGMVSA